MSKRQEDRMTYEELNFGDVVTFEEEDYSVGEVVKARGVVRVNKAIDYHFSDVVTEWQGAWVDACLSDGRMSVRWERGRIWPPYR